MCILKEKLLNLKLKYKFHLILFEVPVTIGILQATVVCLVN